MTKFLCSNCRNQMTGWDGGFFGLPITCECRIYGVTKGRKGCSEFKKRVTKSDLLNKIQSLKEENDILKQKLRKNYIANKQYEEMKRLQEENEQLRRENKELKVANLKFAQEKDDINKRPLRWCE